MLRRSRPWVVVAFGIPGVLPRAAAATPGVPPPGLVPAAALDPARLRRPTEALRLAIDGRRFAREGAPVRLIARIEGARTDPVSVLWRAGGELRVGDEATFRLRGGNHVVTVIATDAAGRVANATVALHVSDDPPEIASVALPGSAVEGQEVALLVEADDHGGRRGLRYAFDWDGSGRFRDERSDPYASHVYADGGRYTVGVRVIDDVGLTAETRRPLVVRGGGGGDLTLMAGLGSGGYVLVSPIKDYSMADRVAYGQWPWTFDLEADWHLGRVLGAGLRQTFPAGGGSWSAQPGLTFWTWRPVLTTYARAAASLHRSPWLYGADLALGLIARTGSSGGVRLEVGVEPLFGGAVRASDHDAALAGRSYPMFGNGVVVPVTAVLGYAIDAL